MEVLCSTIIAHLLRQQLKPSHTHTHTHSVFLQLLTLKSLMRLKGQSLIPPVIIPETKEDTLPLRVEGNLINTGLCIHSLESWISTVSTCKEDTVGEICVRVCV